MENQKVSSKQIMLNYGLILGFASVIISLANYSFGDAYDPHWSNQVIGILVLIGFIVLGIKKLKESNDGFLKMGEAIKTGIGIAFIAALITTLYLVLFTKFIEPAFIDTMVELNREKMIDQSPEISDEILDMQASMTKDYFYAFALGGILFFNLFIGFVVSAITGAVMKRTDEEITSI